MGILDALGLRRAAALMQPQPAIASPWANPASLGGVVIAEALRMSLNDLEMQRETAIQIPAVGRGRNLIVPSIAALALRQTKAGVPTASQPAWLTRTDTAVAPAERIARTVDSLIFNGRALWAIKRASGRIVDAAWVPDDMWDITADLVIEVQGKPGDESEVILFNGYTGGILNDGARTLRNALAIENARMSRALNPIPLTVIRHDPSAQGNSFRPELMDGIDPVTGEADDDIPNEVAELLGRWSEARRSPDGALGYLPPGLIMDVLGANADGGFIETANALRVDVASHLGMPASLLDGTVSQASLTYETTDGNVNRFWSETVPLYVAPIENALSLAVRGTDTEIRFDPPEFITKPTSPVGAPDSATTPEETAA